MIAFLARVECLPWPSFLTFTLSPLIMNRIVLFALVVGLSVVATGCGDGSKPAPTQTPEQKKAVDDGMKQYEKKK